MLTKNKESEFYLSKSEFILYARVVVFSAICVAIGYGLFNWKNVSFENSATILQGTIGVAASIASAAATVYFASLAYKLARLSVDYARRELVETLDKVAVEMVPKVKSYQGDFVRLLNKLYTNRVSEQFMDAIKVYALMRLSTSDLSWYEIPWECPDEIGNEKTGKKIIERMVKIAALSNQEYFDSNSQASFDDEGNEVADFPPDECAPCFDIIKSLGEYVGFDASKIDRYDTENPTIQTELNEIADTLIDIIRLCKSVYEDPATNRLFANKELSSLLSRLDITDSDTPERFEFGREKLISSFYATIGYAPQGEHNSRDWDLAKSLVKYSYLVGPLHYELTFEKNKVSPYWSSDFIALLHGMVEGLYLSPKETAGILNLKIEQHSLDSMDYIPTILECFLNNSAFSKYRDIISVAYSRDQLLSNRLKEMHSIDRISCAENDDADGVLINKIAYKVLGLSHVKHKENVTRILNDVV